jgi:hypothetical protein
MLQVPSVAWVMLQGFDGSCYRVSLVAWIMLQGFFGSMGHVTGFAEQLGPC